MSLAVNDTYGWGVTESWKAWTVFGAASLLALVYLRRTTGKITLPWQVVITCLAPLATAPLGISWMDPSEPVPVWRFYCATLTTLFYTVNYILHMTIIATKVPAHLQSTANSLTQGLGQGARGIGPIIATTFYQYYIDTFGKQSGVSAATTFMVCGVAPSFWFGLLFFNTMYGQLFPSPTKEMA